MTTVRQIDSKGGPDYYLSIIIIPRRTVDDIYKMQEVYQRTKK
jgi:hypothetical protein